MRLEIRRVRAEDEAALERFVVAAVARGDLLASAAPHGEWIVRMLLLDPSQAAVADEAGTLVGLVLPAAKGIVVEPSHRRRGIGRRLVEEAAGIERDQGHGEVLLGRLPGDDAGLAFLRATGFEFHSTLWDLALPADRDIAPPVWPDGYEPRAFDRGRDGDAWGRLFNAAFADHPTPLQFDPAMLEASLADDGFLRGEDTLVVADGTGALVGFCASEPRRLPDGSVMPGAEIWTIGVLPDHQGRGLGRRLLRWGVAHLRGLGVHDVALSVNGRNPRALALYEAEGFERTATRERWACPVVPAGDA